MATAKRVPVEIVRTWYEQGVCKQNMPVVMEYLDDDVEWWCFGPIGFMTNGYFAGKKGVAQFFRSLKATLNVAPGHFTPYEYHGAGDVVTAVGLEQGTINQWGYEVGRPFQNYWVHMFYLQDGKIRKFRANYAVIVPDSVPPPCLPPRRKPAKR